MIHMAKATNAKKRDAGKTEARHAAADSKAAAGKPQPKAGRAAGKYVIAIVIVVAIIGAAIFAGSYMTQNGNDFNTFKSNFNSAPRVAIFVTAYNGTVLSSTVGCATAIIEEVASSRTYHRNTSTIDFDILNQTSCIKSSGLSGKPSNYTITTLQNCLNTTKSEPTIYINYSSSNMTIIRPDYLYISGSDMFLRECGIASEIS
jgi:hypothetical protein